MNKEKNCMNKDYSQWIPLAVTICCAIMTLLIYTRITPKQNTIVFLQVIFAALIPAVLPVITCAAKTEFPAFLNVLITVHIILGVNLGCAMSFYDRFYYWDMFIHGGFGFIASIIFYILLLKWNGEKLNRFGFYALIFLSVMGCAAIWEIYEFVCDRILNDDAQRVAESIALGHTPVYDTMMDIIIAIAGISVFYISLFVDRHCKCRLSNLLYREFLRTSGGRLNVEAETTIGNIGIKQ